MSTLQNQKVTEDDIKLQYNDGKLLNEMLTKEGTISKCYSVFHDFSIRNMFLAYMQLSARGMDLTPIANFNKWKSLGRSVKAGQKALWLCQPVGGTKVPIKEIDKDGKEVTKYIIINQQFKYYPRWFSLEQTQGKEINIDDLKKNVNFDFEKACKNLGIKIVPFKIGDGNVQGYAKVADRELAINPVAEHAEMTLWHEMAHIVLKHDKVDFDRHIKEMEAEACAYILGNIFKVSENQLSNSRGYIQGWFKDYTEIAEENSKRILNVVSRIYKAGTNKGE